MSDRTTNSLTYKLRVSYYDLKSQKRIHKIEAMSKSTGEDKTEETVPENRLMP